MLCLKTSACKQEASSETIDLKAAHLLDSIPLMSRSGLFWGR